MLWQRRSAFVAICIVLRATNSGESVVGGTSEYRQRAVLAVRLRVVRASGLYDATGCRTPYGAGTTLTLCELVIAVLECL